MNAADAVAKLSKLDPAFALNVGDLSDAGKLPPGRASFALERLAVLNEIATELDEDEEDAEHFRQCVSLESFALLELGEKLENPDVLSPLCDWALLLSFAPFSSEQERGERLRAFLAEVPIYLAEAATTFGDPDALWLELALEVADGVPALFAAITHHWNAPNLAFAANAALKIFVRALHALKPIEKRRILDRDTYAKLLQLKQLPFDLQEIEELAHERVAHTEEKRNKLAKDFVGYPDVHNAVRALQRDIPADPLKDRSALLLQARDFCGERDLVPIPSDEECLVVDTPEFARTLIPSTATLAPKPLWPLQRSVAYVTRGTSRSDIRNTVVRDGYPGHHLFHSVANTQGSLWRNAPWTSALHARMGADTVEGFAHYAEAMMKSKGFYREPDDLFQACNDAVWRAHRMRLDIELSTGSVTLEKAAQRLVDRVGLSASTAMSEVRRSTLAPGFSLCATLGKHVIRDLKTEADRHWGKKYSLRRFHHLIMTNGLAPLSVARKRLYAEEP